MQIDFLAKLVLPIQHNIYYLVLSLARFNLWANSYVFMATKAKRDWTWCMEVVGVVFFWTWYLRVIAGTGDWKLTLGYLLISNIAASPVHVQVRLIARIHEERKACLTIQHFLSLSRSSSPTSPAPPPTSAQLNPSSTVNFALRPTSSAQTRSRSSTAGSTSRSRIISSLDCHDTTFALPPSS